MPSNRNESVYRIFSLYTKSFLKFQTENVQEEPQTFFHSFFSKNSFGVSARIVPECSWFNCWFFQRFILIINSICICSTNINTIPLERKYEWTNKFLLCQMQQGHLFPKFTTITLVTLDRISCHHTSNSSLSNSCLSPVNPSYPFSPYILFFSLIYFMIFIKV